MRIEGMAPVIKRGYSVERLICNALAASVGVSSRAELYMDSRGGWVASSALDDQ
jgi:hypothetical protein